MQALACHLIDAVSVWEGCPVLRGGPDGPSCLRSTRLQAWGRGRSLCCRSCGSGAFHTAQRLILRR